MVTRLPRKVLAFVGAVVVVCSLGACSTVSGGATKAQDSKAQDALAKANASSLAPNGIVQHGPTGEESAPVSASKLSSTDLEKIKDKKIRVGIVMQTMDIEWSTEQVRGIKDEVASLGGTVVNVCDGKWDITTQTACINNEITEKPDAIISIPVDDVGMAPAYAKVSQAGIKLIFIDEVAKGLKYPSQYQGMVTSDNEGNGAFAAAALAKYVSKNGVVGILDYGVNFFTTKEREIGFQAWMKAHRPDIKVKVAEFQDAAKSGDVAANFLTANPDVQGMFTEWEVPAEGIITALRGEGKTLPITVVNLASDIATELAGGGMVKAIGAQRPYDEGVAEANYAARAIIGGTNPSFLAYPATPMLRNNLLSTWKLVYHSPAPSAIQAACKGGVCGPAK